MARLSSHHSVVLQPPRIMLALHLQMLSDITDKKRSGAHCHRCPLTAWVYPLAVFVMSGITVALFVIPEEKVFLLYRDFLCCFHQGKATLKPSCYYSLHAVYNASISTSPRGCPRFNVPYLDIWEREIMRFYSLDKIIKLYHYLLIRSIYNDVSVYM